MTRYPGFSIAALAAMLAVSVPASASRIDESIVSSARKSYVFKVYLEGDDIRIESKDGAVTLTGMIAEDLHKSLAEITMKDIEDVKTVDNRLEVKGSSPTANSDAWLHDKVKSSLTFHRGVNAGGTGIDVKDGIVTLHGNAASLAQKDLTAEYAKDIDGVKDVVNEMTVAVEPAPVPRTTGEKVDDVSVAALVRMALVLHHSTSGLYTTVAVRRGVVTLGGRAVNSVQKDMVTRIVGDVNGVKKVKNLMVIEKM